MKTYVMADLHGEIYPIEKAMSVLNLNEDRLFLIGDYVERGSHSEELLDFLIENNNPDPFEPGIHCTIGNHDMSLYQSLVDYETSENVFVITQYEVDTIADSLNYKKADIRRRRLDARKIHRYKNFLGSLPVLYLVTKPYKAVFTHASVEEKQMGLDGISFTEAYKTNPNKIENMLWERETFLEQGLETRNQAKTLKDHVIFVGHTPTIAYETYNMPSGYRRLDRNADGVNTPFYNSKLRIAMIDTGGVFQNPGIFNNRDSYTEAFYTLMCLDDNCFYKIQLNKEPIKVPIEIKIGDCNRQ